MTLKTQITSDLSVFFDTDDFAESASYTPKGGTAVIITAVVSRDNPLQEPYVRGEKTATCEIEVQASEVPDPQYGDEFLLGGEVHGSGSDAFITGGETWDFDPVRGVIYKDDYTRLIGLERQL